jgi:hypothetical protein
MSKNHTHFSKRSGNSGLRRACMLVAAIGALASATALAGSKLETVEECVETGTDLVSLPGVPGGMLAAKACTVCETHRLTFTSNTRYFIGKEAVSYTRLLTAARKGSIRLDVFYRPDTRVLTRLRLASSADANKQ